MRPKIGDAVYGIVDGDVHGKYWGIIMHIDSCKVILDTEKVAKFKTFRVKWASFRPNECMMVEIYKCIVKW